ncbi:MAG: hypothetical protein QNI89_19000 [Desulfobacterales bacterium]|nr:hypothetical protein [Desulfobacterales bacterium]MDJ0991331.1 hypothetical protein [Desulfobacterales bacterium]
MQPVAFDPAADLAPTPFDDELCELARALKRTGLPWRPHVGCFVWDPDRHIKPASPFPADIYFILSLPRFIEIFGSLEAIQEKLIWLPTWHQARLLCQRYGIDPAPPPLAYSPTDELKWLYRLIRDAVFAR